MRSSGTKSRGKLLAVFAALAAAVCIAGGGFTSAVYAEEAHVHNFSETLTSGLKNHWYECECGAVKGLEEHNFVDGICTECGAEKPDPEHVHNFETVYKYDSTNHWQQATCHDIARYTAPHQMVNGECVVCGYSTSVKPGGDTSGSGNTGNTEFPEEKEPVELPANVSEAGGYSESLYAEWQTSNVEGVSAYYKSSEDSLWTEIDEQLIRMVGSSTARLDAVGLKAGSYSLKISSTAGGDILVDSIAVSEYDRSGYAHFNYSDGVGAYNDDGTLKDGALVIYLTDSNKNDISDFVYKNTPTGLVKEDISSYFWQGHKGIGYLLNNRGYENNSARANYGIQKLAFTYGAVAIRILDNVVAEVASDASLSLVEGLTAYNSTDNGGSVGDNGRMARITNAKNLTIEGVGEDAGIYGWGIHFVSNDNLHQYEGSGKSFEVRNITFRNYPEDAIGMEGTQGNKVDPTTGSITGGASSADAYLVSPVERCWIHNNTFYPGYCASPAESDKKEGDGSCDFKRGQYYTLSYNYFTDCHKTNLIGSADASLTYNVTMHHNWWNNCGSRQPLLRRANCHFYNNYASGDMSATPQPSLSYITSARANSYMFSENNYFDGCKQVVLLASGGVVKAYGNTYYCCFSTNSAVEAADRTKAVPNSCKFIYYNIDYSTFDTDPELFYYDAEAKRSDCLLDTAEVARVRVMMYAGVNGFGKSRAETAMNKYVPENAVSVGESGVNVDLASVAKGSSVVSNVYFNGITGVTSGTVKGKGQIITFTLASEAQLTVSTSSTGDVAPELVGSDGTVYLSKFTDTRQIVLQAGTYVIASGQKEKESVITALSFADTSASSAARVKAAEDAINALPQNITVADGHIITAAQQAYNALTAAEKSNFSQAIKAKLDTAVSAYETALVNDVIAKIIAIGEVDKDSFDKINAAQQAYNQLMASQQAKIGAEYRQMLTDAQTAYAEFAVQNVIGMIEELEPVPADLTDMDEVERLKGQYESVREVFETLDDGDEDGEINQQEQVTNISKLLKGLEQIAQLEKLFEFRELLSILDVSTITLSHGAELKNLYGQLTDSQLNALTPTEKQSYADIIERYEILANQMVQCTFIGGKASNEVFSITSGNAKNTQFTVNAYGGELASGLKIESSTEIKFIVSSQMVLKLYIDTSSSKIKVDDVSYSSASEGGDNVVTVTLSAGTHTITKDSSCNLYYATLTPVV